MLFFFLVCKQKKNYPGTSSLTTDKVKGWMKRTVTIMTLVSYHSLERNILLKCKLHQETLWILIICFDFHINKIKNNLNRLIINELQRRLEILRHLL
jgi:hypothetical protein